MAAAPAAAFALQTFSTFESISRRESWPEIQMAMRRPPGALAGAAGACVSRRHTSAAPTDCTPPPLLRRPRPTPRSIRPLPLPRPLPRPPARPPAAVTPVHGRYDCRPRAAERAPVGRPTACSSSGALDPIATSASATPVAAIAPTPVAAARGA